MPKKIAEIQESIAKALNALPEVFSTVQWGGRAYKLPGLNGNRKKPRLLAHVLLSDDGGHVGLSFKLARNRAVKVVDQHDWILPHSFRTLAPSGWITAEVRTRSQVRTVMALLVECHVGMRPGKRLEPSAATKGQARLTEESSEDARRIEAVLRQKRADGWTPAAADSFDD